MAKKRGLTQNNPIVIPDDSDPESLQEIDRTHNRARSNVVHQAVNPARKSSHSVPPVFATPGKTLAEKYGVPPNSAFPQAGHASAPQPPPIPVSVNNSIPVILFDCQLVHGPNAISVTIKCDAPPPHLQAGFFRLRDDEDIDLGDGNVGRWVNFEVGHPPERVIYGKAFILNTYENPREPPIRSRNPKGVVFIFRKKKEKNLKGTKRVPLSVTKGPKGIGKKNVKRSPPTASCNG